MSKLQRIREVVGTDWYDSEKYPDIQSLVNKIRSILKEPDEGGSESYALDKDLISPILQKVRREGYNHGYRIGYEEGKSGFEPDHAETTDTPSSRASKEECTCITSEQAVKEHTIPHIDLNCPKHRPKEEKCKECGAFRPRNTLKPSERIREIAEIRHGSKEIYAGDIATFLD